MPIYLFECTACNGRFELMLKLNECPANCPACQAGTSEFLKLPTAFSSPRQNPAVRNALSQQSRKENSGSLTESGQDQHTHATCRKGYIDKLIARYDKSQT